mmetsp:Transcript_16292/g.22451  ORF Transcript_16292/g.22451 Transcript_16292/m.22451 type:complete len:226 (-) Transcript_16292:468-1145(-)
MKVTRAGRVRRRGLRRVVFTLRVRVIAVLLQHIFTIPLTLRLVTPTTPSTPFLSLSANSASKQHAKQSSLGVIHLPHTRSEGAYQSIVDSTARCEQSELLQLPIAEIASNSAAESIVTIIGCSSKGGSISITICIVRVDIHHAVFTQISSSEVNGVDVGLEDASHDPLLRIRSPWNRFQYASDFNTIAWSQRVHKFIIRKERHIMRRLSLGDLIRSLLQSNQLLV